MLTLYQKGQIQRELEGEVKHTELFVLQYPHLLVPVMNAIQSISSYMHLIVIIIIYIICILIYIFSKNQKSKRILKTVS